MMENKHDHPGVYIPPPLFYVVTFLIAAFIQKVVPLKKDFFNTTTSAVVGSVVILVGVVFLLPALRKFFTSKNTVVTVKGANSLQTTGIYSVSRNPIYWLASSLHWAFIYHWQLVEFYLDSLFVFDRTGIYNQTRRTISCPQVWATIF